MAIRRCFSKKIVRSDDFLDLPATTQLLYFQLGMEADDRGYVNNARSVIKITGCGVGDLEMLISKRFVLLREERLILIKGWRINNTIQPTRISESLYVDDLKKLFFDEHGSYTEKETPLPVLATICRQNDDKLLTQENIREEKIIKDNLIEDNLGQSNLIQKNETGIFKGIEVSNAAKILFLSIPTSFDSGISSPNKDRYCFYFDSLLKQGIDERDIKDALEDIFRDLDEDDIHDKYLYLISRLNKILRLNSDEFEDDNLATTDVMNNNSLDEEEVNDDDLPF